MPQKAYARVSQFDMRIIADLHIHSKYSRATSRDMDVEHLAKWAEIKGINVLGTGDFTHPLWLAELKEKLAPAEGGLFILKDKKMLKDIENWRESSENNVRFILTSEISCIYSKNNRTRKIHLVVLSPDFETVEKINTHLGWIGNLKSDGRPILGLDAKELLKIILDANPRCLVIPAHAWTPHFSIFGSNSGFNSIEECFDDLSKYIYAIETGLSSDPAMNWRLSQLDKITLVSNSDSHSPARIGREANVFDIAPTALSYGELTRIIKERDAEKFLYTLEFFPEEGKYHYDGHRNCGVSFHPEETKKLKGICPKCGRSLTIGVMYRVSELADRDAGGKPSTIIPFKNSIPLAEIIGDALGVGPASKLVIENYRKLINALGNEFNILFESSYGEIEEVAGIRVAEGIERVRQGRVKIEPGFDNEYGKIKIFEEGEQIAEKQGSLF